MAYTDGQSNPAACCHRQFDRLTNITFRQQVIVLVDFNDYELWPVSKTHCAISANTHDTWRLKQPA